MKLYSSGVIVTLFKSHSNDNKERESDHLYDSLKEHFAQASVFETAEQTFGESYASGVQSSQFNSVCEPAAGVVM